MENKLKIGVIVAVAFLAGILGTLSFSSFESNQEISPSSSSSSEQNVGIGAYVIVEAYHDDGTMYQRFEGHNTLHQYARNYIVACTTGLDTTPIGTTDCVYDATDLALYSQNQTNIADVTTTIIPGDVTLLPLGCNPNGNCEGWTLEGTFDFIDLDCEPEVDCLNAYLVASGDEINPSLIDSFNYLDISPTVPLGPNDRLYINMTFNVPP